MYFRFPVSGLKTVLLVLLAIVVSLPAASSPSAAQDSFQSAIASLVDKSFKVKQRAINVISASGDPRAIALLTAMRDGTLYYRKTDKRIVFAEKVAKGFALVDALTAENLGQTGRRKVRKISINNRLRTVLKGAIGSLQLFAEAPAVRLSAARALLANPSGADLPLLDKARARENDPAVAAMLTLAQAAARAQNGPLKGRTDAVAELSGSMNPDVWQVLGRLAADTGEAASRDDRVVAEAARAALDSVEARKQLFSWLETAFFGLSLGSVLLLAAVGLAITFGVMGVINMAHGEMLMIGAYTTFVVQQLMPGALDYSLFVAVPAAFVVTGLLGICLERSVIRVLYGRPLETLLATFGISLILQQAVRTIFSPLNQPVVTPEWMSGFYEVNGALSLTYNRVVIIGFCLLVFLALLLVLRRTALGLQMRAVTQNRAMASSMGINTGWVDAMTFGLGSGIAGIAGVALSQLTNVGPNLGQAYIIDSFMVVVFGGVGNLWGTFVGAMVLGIVNKFLEPVTGAVVAKILVLVFIILFIQRRPRGLFALRGRSVEG